MDGDLSSSLGQQEAGLYAAGSNYGLSEEHLLEQVLLSDEEDQSEWLQSLASSKLSGEIANLKESFDKYSVVSEDVDGFEGDDNFLGTASSCGTAEQRHFLEEHLKELYADSTLRLAQETASHASTEWPLPDATTQSTLHERAGPCSGGDAPTSSTSLSLSSERTTSEKDSIGVECIEEQLLSESSTSCWHRPERTSSGGDERETISRLQEELLKEAEMRAQSDQFNENLQVEYETVLKRLAECESHIDRLRLSSSDDHIVTTRVNFEYSMPPLSESTPDTPSSPPPDNCGGPHAQQPTPPVSTSTPHRQPTSTPPIAGQHELSNVVFSPAFLDDSSCDVSSGSDVLLSSLKQVLEGSPETGVSPAASPPVVGVGRRDHKRGSRGSAMLPLSPGSPGTARVKNSMVQQHEPSLTHSSGDDKRRGRKKKRTKNDDVRDWLDRSPHTRSLATASEAPDHLRSYTQSVSHNSSADSRRNEGTREKPTSERTKESSPSEGTRERLNRARVESQTAQRRPGSRGLREGEDGTRASDSLRTELTGTVPVVPLAGRPALAAGVPVSPMDHSTGGGLVRTRPEDLVRPSRLPAPRVFSTSLRRPSLWHTPGKQADSWSQPCLQGEECSQGEEQEEECSQGEEQEEECTQGEEERRSLQWSASTPTAAFLCRRRGGRGPKPSRIPVRDRWARLSSTAAQKSLRLPSHPSPLERDSGFVGSDGSLRGGGRSEETEPPGVGEIGAAPGGGGREGESLPVEAEEDVVFSDGDGGGRSFVTHPDLSQKAKLRISILQDQLAAARDVIHSLQAVPKHSRGSDGGGSEDSSGSGGGVAAVRQSSGGSGGRGSEVQPPAAKRRGSTSTDTVQTSDRSGAGNPPDRAAGNPPSRAAECQLDWPGVEVERPSTDHSHSLARSLPGPRQQSSIDSEPLTDLPPESTASPQPPPSEVAPSPHLRAPPTQVSVRPTTRLLAPELPCGVGGPSSRAVVSTDSHLPPDLPSASSSPSPRVGSPGEGGGGVKPSPSHRPPGQNGQCRRRGGSGARQIGKMAAAIPEEEEGRTGPEVVDAPGGGDDPNTLDIISDDNNNGVPNDLDGVDPSLLDTPDSELDDDVVLSASTPSSRRPSQPAGARRGTTSPLEPACGGEVRVSTSSVLPVQPRGNCSEVDQLSVSSSGTPSISARSSCPSTSDGRSGSRCSSRHKSRSSSSSRHKSRSSSSSRHGRTHGGHPKTESSIGADPSPGRPPRVEVGCPDVGTRSRGVQCNLDAAQTTSHHCVPSTAGSGSHLPHTLPPSAQDVASDNFDDSFSNSNSSSKESRPGLTKKKNRQNSKQYRDVSVNTTSEKATSTSSLPHRSAVPYAPADPRGCKDAALQCSLADLLSPDQSASDQSDVSRWSTGSVYGSRSDVVRRVLPSGPPLDHRARSEEFAASSTGRKKSGKKKTRTRLLPFLNGSVEGGGQVGDVVPRSTSTPRKSEHDPVDVRWSAPAVTSGRPRNQFNDPGNKMEGGSPVCCTASSTETGTSFAGSVNSSVGSFVDHPSQANGENQGYSAVGTRSLGRSRRRHHQNDSSQPTAEVTGTGEAGPPSQRCYRKAHDRHMTHGKSHGSRNNDCVAFDQDGRHFAVDDRPLLSVPTGRRLQENHRKSHLLPPNARDSLLSEGDHQRSCASPQSVPIAHEALGEPLGSNAPYQPANLSYLPSSHPQNLHSLPLEVISCPTTRIATDAPVPSNHQQSYTAPSNHQQPYLAPSNHQQSYPAPSNHQQSYSAPSNHHQVYPARNGVEEVRHSTAFNQIPVHSEDAWKTTQSPMSPFPLTTKQKKPLYSPQQEADHSDHTPSIASTHSQNHRRSRHSGKPHSPRTSQHSTDEKSTYPLTSTRVDSVVMPTDGWSPPNVSIYAKQVYWNRPGPSQVARSGTEAGLHSTSLRLGRKELQSQSQFEEACRLARKLKRNSKRMETFLAVDLSDSFGH